MTYHRRGRIGTATDTNGVFRPSYFVAELDGTTAPDRETAARWETERLDAEAEYDAETAIERAYETNDRYRWEVEEDERRAAAFGF